MRESLQNFLNIKYTGARFDGGRLPLDVLGDLQALQDILTTFAREIWLQKHGRERMPNGYTEWFHISLTGVGNGSAIPKLDLQVLEESQQTLIAGETRRELMNEAVQAFADVLAAANSDGQIALSPAQIRNFNRFLTNLKEGEQFHYSPEATDISVESPRVISLDAERRKRFLTRLTSTYIRREQGKARLKNVDESGLLRFIDANRREIPVRDESKLPAEYGRNIGNYYEYDLTLRLRHDDSIAEVVVIHELSLLEHPATAIIDQMANLQAGWLDGYGQPIAEVVRETAKDFIQKTINLPAFYAIAPTEDGGILFEYEASGWDYGIDFKPDGKIIFFGIETEGDQELFDELENLQSLQERIKETLEK